MEIKNLQINNFKKLDELKLDFAPGINVIIGHNEAGKSTVADAILQALYADPGSRSNVFKEKYEAWNKPGKPKLTMEFNSDVQTFVLEKDFGARTTTLTDKKSGKMTASFTAITDAIAKVLGAASRPIYEHTAFIKHSDIARIESDRDLKGAIEKAAAASGDVSLNQVVFKLEQELKDLRVGLDRPAKNPGALKFLGDKVSQLKIQLEASRQKYQLYLKAKESGEESGSKLQEITDKITGLRTLIDNNKMARQATEELKKIDAEILEMEKVLGDIQSADAELKKVNAAAEQFVQFEKMNWEETGIKLTQLAELKKTLAGQLKQFEINRAKPKKVKPGLHTIGLVIFVVFAVTGLVFSLTNSNWLYFLGAGAIGAIVFVYLQLNQASTLAPQGMTDLEHELTDKYTQASSSLANILHKLGIKSVEEFYALKAEYVGITEQVNQIKAHLKGMLGGKDPEEIKSRQLQLLTQKKEIEHNKLTEDIKNSLLTPEDYLRKSRELELLQLDQKRLEEARTTAKVRVSDADIDTDTIVQMEEQLEMAMSDLQFKKDREKILQFTIDGLKSALTETAASAETLVSKEVEKYLPKLTGNRYKDTKLTDKFEVKVFSKEKNGWVDPVASLSSGAVDQIYFIIRVALINFLFKDKQIPIILDDPFVTFDKERLAQTKLILQEIAKKHQIFLFTHNAVYQDWGKTIRLK